MTCDARWPEINLLTALDSLASGDAIPLHSSVNGDTRRAALSTLRSFVLGGQEALFSDYLAQYEAPTTSGFTVAVRPERRNTWLILTPTGGFATGTINLPALAHIAAGQELLVNSTQAVTTLTVNAASGTSVLGAPTTLAANGFFRLRFDAVLNRWYRVG